MAIQTKNNTSQKSLKNSPRAHTQITIVTNQNKDSLKKKCSELSNFTTQNVLKYKIFNSHINLTKTTQIPE